MYQPFMPNFIKRFRKVTEYKTVIERAGRVVKEMVDDF
jgi:hypothetical protein